MPEVFELRRKAGVGKEDQRAKRKAKAKKQGYAKIKQNLAEFRTVFVGNVNPSSRVESRAAH